MKIHIKHVYEGESIKFTLILVKAGNPPQRIVLTCLKSVHTCNFTKCINTYILQNLDTKAM